MYCDKMGQTSFMFFMATLQFSELNALINHKQTFTYVFTIDFLHCIYGAFNSTFLTCACLQSSKTSFIVHFSEVGVAQNSSQVLQVAQIAQVAQLRNLRCALCLFFRSCAICVALYAFFFSAGAICVCESVNLIFVAL